MLITVMKRIRDIFKNHNLKSKKTIFTRGNNTIQFLH